jgi:ABC-type branched-subunit amino acid transport system substrate-binding protein
VTTRAPWLAALLVAPALAAAAGPQPATAGDPAAARAALVAAGRTIYREGVSPSGGEITAMVGGDLSPVPGAALPCASCHGEDGLGRPEGAVVPSVVTWSELTRPGGHHHPGRSHAPFDARSAIRSVALGVDPDGHELDAAMPRYSMARRDEEALLAYLQVLEWQLDPGVTAEAVRLGTVLPSAGRLAGAGAAMRAALEAAVADANAGGGLNGRKVVLVVEGFDADREDGLAAARRLLAGPPIFALVSGFVPGAEDGVAALAEEGGVPFVGPFTPFSAGGAGHYTFHVLPGLVEQAGVLATWAAARPELAATRAVVLHAEGAPFAAAAEGALSAARGKGWKGVEAQVTGPDGPGAEQVERLKASGVGTVFLLGDDAALAGLLQRADAVAWAPWVLAPGTLAARAAAGAPASFEGRIHLAYPSRPADLGEAARARLAGLASAGAPARHQAAQVSALSAFSVLAEGLRRTGRQLSRARLVAALEGLSDHQTGLTPPVTYGPRRRVGARGGYVVAVEVQRQQLRPVSGWVRLD